ncbi:MAG: hypothetical protein MUE30_00940 [Spirosomaceae bacterium]|nr:hypothetical protein [Spirosomataceae bacterium]
MKKPLLSHYQHLVLPLLCFWVFVAAIQKNSTHSLILSSNHSSLDSLDAQTGLVIDPNLMLVKAHCTGCHSPKLITQTRLKRDQWQERIRWMQRNHKLWDLGGAEKTVLDYLEKHYSPSKTAYSRREALQNVKWYRLENQ